MKLPVILLAASHGRFQVEVCQIQHLTLSALQVRQGIKDLVQEAEESEEV